MTLKKNIWAFIEIGILGTVGHFIYELTNQNFIAGLFFPVNESTWEHLKLLFFPTLIYSLFEYIFSEEKPENYLFAVTYSVICGMLSIVALFYTYRGVIGKNYDFINISIYFISIIIMLFKKRKLLRSGKFSSKAFFWISEILLVLITALFMIWSYNPPTIGLFTPPV